MLLLLVSLFDGSFACWGGGALPEGMKSKMLNVTNKEIWNGWDAPPGAQEAWMEWLDAFNQSYLNSGGHLTEEEKAAGVLPAGYGEPGWPNDWVDLKEGFGGMEPPPWAYVPKNMGKPSLCYLKPVYGACTSNLYRWGYNPFMDACQNFRYSGCGGNQNNFKTKESCESECVNPVMGCET